jgi:hypothetical protein
MDNVCVGVCVFCVFNLEGIPMKQNPVMKSFLLEWLLLHGNNWVFHKEMFALGKDIMLIEMARNYKYIEEEDQIPEHDKTLWGSYFRLTNEGREYATMP